MWLKKKKYLKKNGFVREYYSLCQYNPSKSSRVEQESISLKKVPIAMDMIPICRERRRLLKQAGLGKTESPARKREMPKAIPSPLRELFQNAGFNIVGNRLNRSKKNYFTLRAAETRFNLLGTDFQKLVRTPSSLLELERLALSRLKAANRLKTPAASFDKCLAKTVSEAVKSAP